VLYTGSRQGVPNSILMNNNQAVEIDSALLPDAEEAVADFEANGGQLTLFSAFGIDPLQDNPSLVAQREAEFHHQFSDFSQFFHTVVNNDYYLFREGILCFIDISRRLALQS